MRSTYVCFWIVVAIITTLVVLVVRAATHGQTTEAVGWSIAIAILVVHLLLTSLHVVDADELMPAFFLGTYLETYISGTLVDEEDVYGNTMLERHGCRGLLGTDFVLLLWPLWSARLLPATTIRIRAHVAQAYTLEASNQDTPSPRIPIHIDLTMQVAFAPDLAKLFRTFGGLFRQGYNLGKEKTIKYRLTTPEESLRLATGEEVTSRKGSYEGTVLEYYLMRTLESVLQEALRTASTRFPWRANQGGRGDILADRDDFEDEVLLCLAEAKESAFVRGGFLAYIDSSRYPPDRKGARKAVHYGPVVRSLDSNATTIEPENLETKNAQSKPMTENYAAEAEAKKIRILAAAEADRLLKISRETGIDVSTLRQLETLEKTNPTLVSDGVVGLLGLLVRGAGQAAQAATGRRQQQLPPPSQNPPNP